jgi:hypothetical protein
MYFSQTDLAMLACLCLLRRTTLVPNGYYEAALQVASLFHNPHPEHELFYIYQKCLGALQRVTT